MNYTDLLESLLVMEFGKSPERAKELVHAQANAFLVTKGIMEGNQSLRPIALELDHRDWISHGLCGPSSRETTSPRGIGRVANMSGTVGNPKTKSNQIQRETTNKNHQTKPL